MYEERFEVMVNGWEFEVVDTETQEVVKSYKVSRYAHDLAAKMNDELND